ncbi:hypothetical protein HR060_03515 [Catenovulum sp. SM1970]|uniref:hypothetical protein n=1 Tax=Marinifaba aquimaris TaxID=2741323 RepID=UPI00157230A5|nr:hypothetical protein [Marinifaba aquimaris]NTS75927.1 hypothetical protein [Marinifaba aquimaris]
MKRITLTLCLIWLCAFASSAFSQEKNDKKTHTLKWLTSSEAKLNQFSTLDFQLIDVSGQLLKGADFTITGAIPAHAHGFITEPKLMEVSAGHYQIQGLKFHMYGYWLLELKTQDHSFSYSFYLKPESKAQLHTLLNAR